MDNILLTQVEWDRGPYQQADSVRTAFTAGTNSDPVGPETSPPLRESGLVYAFIKRLPATRPG